MFDCVYMCVCVCGWQHIEYSVVLLQIRLCNCNGVLKIYIIAENIVETCLIEFL